MENKYEIKNGNHFHYHVIVKRENGRIKNRYFQRYKEALDCYLDEGIKMYAVRKGGFNAVGYYVVPVALMFQK